jgi:AraC family transcriptional regulator of adaptative response/methylated-DNA-[protein]-cysteine methyltransferase
MIAGATDGGICFLDFTDRRMLEHQLMALRRRFKAGLAPGRHAHLTTLRRELAEYFAGKRQDFDVPLEMRGTAFEMRVWQELQRIPYGETRSYSEMAQRVGRPAAVRAVGHANGLNTISVIVPCHRVVGKNGDLVGYGGGLWRKRRLLHLESASAL